MTDDQTPRRQLTEQEVAELRALIAERAKGMCEDDLKKLLADQDKAEKKLLALDTKLPGLVRQVKVGFSMVKDYWKGDYRAIPFWSVASVAAAIGYFIAPTDAIPDFIPLVGYLDDAAVLAAVMAGFKQDLKAYCEARGISLDAE